MAVDFLVALRTVSALNAREHWAVKAKRVKEERAITSDALRCVHPDSVAAVALMARPLLVTITRVGPRRIDFDNAISGLKGVRDEIARWLGVDDGDQAVVDWAYRMARGPYTVRVRIEVHPDPPPVDFAPAPHRRAKKEKRSTTIVRRLWLP